MWAQTVMTCGSAGRLDPAHWAQAPAGGAIRPVGAAPCRIKQRIAEPCAIPPSRFVRIPTNPTTHPDGIRPPRHLRSRRRVGEPRPLSRSGRCFRLSPLGGSSASPSGGVVDSYRNAGRRTSEWGAQGPSVGEPQEAAIELRRVEVLPEPGHELEPLAEGVNQLRREWRQQQLAVPRRVG